MKRYPNPWVFVPAVLGLAIGGTLGWVITRVGGGSFASSLLIAILSGLLAGVGVGTVAVLSLRSFDEWTRARTERRPPPEVGCEVPEPDPPAEP